jgi:hypothetical protein
MSQEDYFLFHIACGVLQPFCVMTIYMKQNTEWIEEPSCIQEEIQWKLDIMILDFTFVQNLRPFCIFSIKCPNNNITF